jgi:DNA-binding transcriptional LysR family regulator
MPRTLDLTALRTLVAVAESGGVTRAAGRLHLTQSAVSMQVKRLEEALGMALLDRSARGATPTAAGEQLLAYARRMLALNDEAMERLTGDAYAGEITLGAPHDIVYPRLPAVLARFGRTHPRVKVSLVSSHTRRLKAQFERGEADLILTTEDSAGLGAETLAERPLAWVGAPGGRAWTARPLPVAFEHICAFRPLALKALEEAGLPWTMAVESDSTRAIEASVSADLAVMCMIADALPPQCEVIAHGGALPALPLVRINLYVEGGPKAAMVAELAAAVRDAFGAPVAGAA